MIPSDNFRFRAHVLLVELDATTTQLMMLVVVGEISGTQWDEALSRQSAAYKEWISAVAGISIDPMPALDGRAPGDPLGSRTSRKAARRERRLRWSLRPERRQRAWSLDDADPAMVVAVRRPREVNI
jgi:hypothetical protein